MTPLHVLWFSIVALAMLGIWHPTPVSHRWMARLRPALARYAITPKVLAHVMDTPQKRIYRQLDLNEPMQAPRLEEVWAAYPAAHIAYCIAVLEEYGYLVLHQSPLAEELRRLMNEKKAMASMTLKEIA